MFTTISPAIDRYVATEAALNEQNNPISNGAARGIDAAKSSLSLAPLVQPFINRPSAAMRMIGSIPTHFRNPAPGTGRAGMMQSIAQAMGPAMQEYYNELDTQNALDMQMAAEQNKHAERELDRQYKREALKEQMLMRQQHMGETARHHRAMEEAALMRGTGSNQLTAGQKGFFMRKKAATGSVLHEINTIQDKLNKFEEETKGSTFNPFNPYIGGITNISKDVIGYATSHKQLEKERTARKSLDSALYNFNSNFEKALKGGTLSDATVKRFEKKGSLPTFGSDPLPDLKQKLEDIKNHISSERESAVLSLQRGEPIDPIDLENLKLEEGQSGNEEFSKQAEIEELLRLRKEILSKQSGMTP